ncbi:hypothetical protein EMIT0P171_100057 [Pseudomonas sp. IT-P171]
MPSSLRSVRGDRFIAGTCFIGVSLFGLLIVGSFQSLKGKRLNGCRLVVLSNRSSEVLHC